MQLPKGIRRRGNVFWVWTRVPTKLVTAYGREFVREAIDESDINAALAKGLRRLADLNDQWQAIREHGELTPGKLAQLAAEFRAEIVSYNEMMAADLPSEGLQATVQASLDEIGDDPANMFQPATIKLLQIVGATDYERGRRKVLNHTLRRHLMSGETADVAWAADDLIARHRLNVQRGSDPYKQLCEALLRASIETLQEQTAPAEPRSAKPASAPAQHVNEDGEALARQTVMQRFEAYAMANPKGITADSLNINRQVVRTFADFLPEGFPASKITKRQVREWQDALRLFPIKASESREFRGKAFEQVIQLNQTVGKPVLSKASVNKYLASLSSFCSWLANREEIPANPVIGLRDILDKRASSPKPYTSQELQRLFASPLFTGFERDGREHLQGNTMADDWRIWLPLIALYTGARLGEIAQLLVADIRQEGQHWCIHLTTEGGHGKSLKTTSSRRIIPVHSELQALGFLDHVEGMRAKCEARLFPDLTPDTRGQLGGKPSKWFGRLFARIDGVKVDKGRNFHSFRHGFADALRRAGYLDDQIGILLGHVSSTSSMTRGYGVLAQGDLAFRVQMLGKISFPETAHLRG